MVDVRRPTCTATPTQTIPSSRHWTSSSDPALKMPLEILERIPTFYLAPFRFLVEICSEEDYARMMGRDPEEMILAQARTAAYVSMINKSLKISFFLQPFILITILFSCAEHDPCC